MVAIPQIITEDRASGLVIPGSLKFEYDKEEYLYRNTGASGTDGNRRTWTVSFWVKRCHLSSSGEETLWSHGSGSNGEGYICFKANNQIQFINDGHAGNSAVTTRLCRDVNGWYHIVWAVDSTQAANDDRTQIWINGTKLAASDYGSTSISASNEGYIQYYSSENMDVGIGARQRGHHNGSNGNGKNGFTGYMSQFHFIDGKQLPATEFGFVDPQSGDWRPKAFKNTLTMNIGTASNQIKSSEQTSDGQVANNVYDYQIGNNMADRWRNNGSEDNDLVNKAYLGCDFGSGVTKDIRQVRLLQGRSNTMGEAVQGVKIQYSDNGSSWSDAGGAHTINSSTFKWQEINVSSSGSHRYWRMLCSSASSSGVWIVTEMSWHAYTSQPDYGPFGYYLPMDGIGPVGRDHSGNNNDFMPRGLGTVPLKNATGGLPILDTQMSGHSVKGSGSTVRGDFGSRTVTVAYSKFVIDGVSQASLELLRGGTYKFDQSHSSNSGHPLRFSTSDNGTHGGGSEYTDGRVTSGTPGNAGAYTTITVPHNAADTLYYYCSAHSGMGGSATVTTDVQKADPYAWKCILAAPLNGIPRDYSNILNCTQASAYTMTSSDLLNTGSFMKHYNFYGSSLEWDGATNDWARIDSFSSGSPFHVQSGDFTVECWAYRNSGQAGNNPEVILNFGSGESSNSDYIWYLRNYNDHTEFGTVTGNTQTTVLLDQYEHRFDRWVHYACQRRGNVYEVYVNGALSGTRTITSTLNNNNNARLSIGNSYSSNDEWGGSIQDVRFYSGVCKYSTDFATGSPIDSSIVSDSPSGISYPVQYTEHVNPTTGSVATNAVHALRSASHADYSLGDGDFTVEFWVWQAFHSGFTALIADNLYTSSSNGGWCFYANAAELSVARNNAGLVNGGVGSILPRQWQHICWERTGSTNKLYQNGVERASASDSTDFVGDQILIGASNYGSSYPNYRFPGYISNLRIVKGSNVYGGAFTPPRAPLTNVTNTKLLCCQNPSDPTARTVGAAAFTAGGNGVQAKKFNPFDDFDAPSGPASYSVFAVNASMQNRDSVKDGGLTIKYTTGHDNDAAASTIPMYSGKYYAEFISPTWNTCEMVGISYEPYVTRYCEQACWPGKDADSGIGYQSNGKVLYRNGSNIGAPPGGGLGSVPGSVVMIAVDIDAKKIAFGIDGIWSAGTIKDSQVAISDGTDKPPYIFGIGDSSGSAAVTMTANFGQRPFIHQPPIGYSPVSNASHDRPPILDPSKYFKPSIYTGSGGQQKINVGFQPDLMMGKCRSHSKWFWCVDTVRGLDYVNYPGANNVESNDQHIESVDSTGYTVDDIDSGTTNESGMTYVSYAWKAGGNKGTWNLNDEDVGSKTAAGLTTGDHSVVTGCSINTTAGFSIITWTMDSSGSAKNIPHGLSRAPEVVIMKQRNFDGDWIITHPTFSASTKCIYLNKQDGEDNSSDFNNAFPTADYIPTNTTGVNGRLVVMYAWHSVRGLQAFGEYQGNGASEGAIVNCGFKPSMVWIKENANSNPWCIHDIARDGTNEMAQGNLAFANGTESVHSTDHSIDMLSNGFKLRTVSGWRNGGLDKYFYFAWADSSHFSLYGSQSNAHS